MKKLDVGQVISILANIGVIAGIVFLGFEIRQNSRAMAIQTRLDVDDAFRESTLIRIENPDLLHATTRFADGETLTSYERLLLNEYNLAILSRYLIVWAQARDGLRNEDDIPVASWRSNFHNRPLMQESWSRFKQGIQGSEFISWAEENVVSAP